MNARPTLLAALSILVLGCGDDDLGLRYRAERDLYGARREIRRLTSNPDAAGAMQQLAIADNFVRVGNRYRDVGRDDPSPSEATRSTRRIAANALLLATEHYAAAGELDRAMEIVLDVRTSWQDDPSIAMAAQTQLVEFLQRNGDPDEVLAALWDLAAYPPVSPEGAVRHPVFNAPMVAVRVAGADGSRAPVAEVRARAIGFYEDIHGSWTRRTPALLADLHRSTLLEGRGEWRAAGRLLENALEAYPDSVLAAQDAASIAFRTARIYLRDRRDPEAATRMLNRTRAIDPESGAAGDATMGLAALAYETGDPARAIALYREVVESRRFDKERAPVAQFSLARVLQAEGRWEEALTAYQACRASYPKTPEGLEVPFVIAAHHVTLGEPETARAELARASIEFRNVIDTFPGTVEAFTAYRYLTRALLEQEDWSGAVLTMREFAEAFPNREEAPVALLEAASVTRSNLEDATGSDAILGLIEERYPNTRFAAEARRLREQG